MTRSRVAICLVGETALPSDLSGVKVIRATAELPDHVRAELQAHWFGYTLLVIPPGGHGGTGIMYGTNYVQWSGYRSQHEVVNEVREAVVDARGALRLRVLVVRRHLVLEEGMPPDRRLVAELPAKDFYIHLEPVPGQPRELSGIHEYTRGTERYQEAVERYRHLG